LDDNEFADFIAKPVMPARLAESIAKTWGLAQVADDHPNPPDTMPRFLPGKKILLVEDNALNQEVATELLLDMGFDVDLAEDGVIAVDKAGRNDYDLILMDMQMPRMDGLEATRRIRKLSRHADTPIVAMTANAFAEDRAASVEAGMNDHLSKPVDPELLAHVLALWLPAAVSHMEESQWTSQWPEQVDADPALGKLMEQLDRVPGLSLRHGLRSFRGNAEHLARLLQRFVNDHGNDPQLTRQQLQAGDSAAAQRTLHTLKGLAGTAGLLDLQALAADAERHVRQGDSDGQVANVLQQMAPAMAALQNTLREWEPQKPATGASSREDLLQRLVTLRTLLSTDDLDAADYYAEIRDSMAVHFPGQCQALGKAMEDFAFNDALLLLEPLLAQAARPS
jgi:CheY-like chemotaxis protein